MGSYPDEFPFGIMEVVELLHLRVRRQQANSVYVDCPFCGDRRGRMNVNFVKNVWRCNHCDEHGGMLALYAKLNHTTTSDAYWEIAEALCDNTHEEHARSGNEAQQQPVSTGSPSSGARAAAAGHSSSERKTVPQSDKASPAEIHQTLSLLLAQLTLRPAHREHLRSPKRGLSDEQIEALGFKSTPPPFLCRSITDRLIRQGCRVQGVPGFYRDDSGHWTMAFYNCDNVRKLVLNPSEPGLIRALGLDASKFRRLRQMDGDTETLAWLQLEKRTGQRITDDMLRWSKKEQISAKDLVFIADRMSLVQIKNYLERQKEYFDGSCQQALTTWQDYLAMAERLHYDTSDEIVYRVRKLRQRHDELVLQSEAGSLEEQASKMAAKYPHVNAICVELQEKYAYSDDDYTVLAPQDIFEIIKEGRMLHHCVGNDGAGERYYDRMERRESFIMFLRRTEEPNDPYYTLEIEPDGTVRQKRTLFDRQYEDIEQATEFLIKWQKVIAARLTGRDLKLAERSRELRKEEFIQMRKDRVIIHTGHLAGRLLADVLLADLMENTEVMQPQALPAAA